MATIMVVDDEESIRTLLDTVLTRKGHEVLLADSGARAIALHRRERPDVAIVDLHMPGMNGIDLLEKLREVDRQLPVLMLTGMPTDEAEKRARELGVTEFLEKGFSLHRLGNALREVLTQAGTSTRQRPMNESAST